MSAASPALHGVDPLKRRRFRTGLVVSLVAHAVAFAAFFLAPPGKPVALHPIVSVQLVAAVPSAPKRAAPAPARPASPKPAPPRPASPKPPPPVAKKTVLPKQPSAQPSKPRPARPQPAPVREAPPQELDYDDAMASLRRELGEDVDPSPLDEARRTADAQAAAEQASAAGAAVDRELANWVLATRIHVRRAWVTPPEFLDRGLQTDLLVTLMADGTVLGDPEIVAPSGDPYFDENAVRALRRASPLPAPPEAGEWPFRFEPEGKTR